MRKVDTREDKLLRLAKRTAAGEVVFFIGAGFSIDSERNTTTVLIARLLARFEALSEEMAANLPATSAGLAHRLRKALRITFSLQQTGADASGIGNIFDNEPLDKNKLPPEADSRSILQRNLANLAQQYYLINDWACASFEAMIENLSGLPEQKDLPGRVNIRENGLLCAIRKFDPFSSQASLAPMDLQWLMKMYKESKADQERPDHKFAGKALFLDTLGFLSIEVMGGNPMHSDLAKVVKTTKTLIRDRHLVLARFAAEGLSPSLVTTNYDLLVDCGYRVVGILPRNPPLERWGTGPDPLKMADAMRLPQNSRCGHYSRIASAAGFFMEGDAHESAVIHKIHGCVEEYRIAREFGGPAEVRKVLPRIVFTFREIQNWREDSWSRDYLSTVLRTRTVVFAGYSAADPVLHDTFRTVYEEMSRQWGAAPRAAPVGVPTPKTSDPIPSKTPQSSDQPIASPPPPGANARAFFFDLEEKRDFHGLAVLHAAGVAAGDLTSDPTYHPNLITYFKNVEPHLFPTVDEAFVWLYHLTIRELQARTLLKELPRLAYQLFGHPPAPADVTSIDEAFKGLMAAEHKQARAFDLGARKGRSATVRDGFRRMTDWTHKFLVRLMRQYQLAETVISHGTERFAIREVFELPWYRPINEHPQWAAWAAVLELAIRRAASQRIGRKPLAVRATPHIEVDDQTSPTILFRTTRWTAPRDGPSARQSVTIALRLMRLWGERSPGRPFEALPPILWELPPEPMVWWRESDGGRPQCTPSALDLWNSAAGAGGDILTHRGKSNA